MYRLLLIWLCITGLVAPLHVTAETVEDMLIYRGGADTSVPEYKRHNAISGFGSEGTAQDITDDQEFIQVTAHPDSGNDEKVACSRDSASDVNCQVWNGSSWGNLQEVTDFNGTGSERAYTVCYEQSSGTAMVFYRDSNTSNNEIQYRTWNGSWSGQSFLQDVGSQIRTIRCYAEKGTNYIAVMAKDQSDDLHVVIWNGSSNLNYSEIDVNASACDLCLSYAGAWETSAGDFVAAYYADGDHAIDGNQYSRSGDSFSKVDDVIASSNIPTGEDTWIEMVANPGASSDQILLVVADNDDDIEQNVWDGSSWGTESQLNSNIGVVGTTSHPLDIQFEHSTANQAVAIYGTQKTTLNYRRWEGSWQSEQSMPAAPNNVSDQLLSADTNSDNIMATVVTTAGDIVTNEWTGTSFEGSWTTHETASSNIYWNAWFTYDNEQEIIDVSGTCKQYDQTTDCDDTGTLRVAVNNTLQGQTQTTVDGTWTISSVTVTSGDVVTVFIDGADDANEAVAVTKYDGSGDITGMELYEEHLSIGSDDSPTLSNAEISAYDNSVSGDEDIFFDVNADNPYTYFIDEDEGSPTYTTVGSWPTLSQGCTGEIAYNVKGSGNDKATWTFSDIPNGTYSVAAYWNPFTNRAKDAPFTVYDDTTSLGTTDINQENAPDDFTYAGCPYEYIGSPASYEITTGTLKVILTDDADDYVIADSIYIECLDCGVNPGPLTVDALEQSARGMELFIVSGTTFQPGEDVETGHIDIAGTLSMENNSIAVNGNWDAADGSFSFGTGGTARFLGTQPDAIRKTIDNLDGSPAFVTTGSWDATDFFQGCSGSIGYDAAGGGSEYAQWTFSNIPNGTYSVAATWNATTNRATDAPFTVYDNTTSLGTTDINQENSPDDFTFDSCNYEYIGSEDAYDITTNTLKVRLTDQANEYVIADRVYIELSGANSYGLIDTGAGSFTDVEIINPYEADLLVHWKFDDGAGATASDSSGNGIDATLTLMEESDWDSADTADVYFENSYSLEFDGSEYMDVNFLDLFQKRMPDFTIAAWLKPTTGATRYVVGENISGNKEWSAYIQSDGDVCLKYTQTNGVYVDRCTTGQPATMDAWNHIAWVVDRRDSATVKIYVNGTDETLDGTAVDTTWETDSAPFWVGRDRYGYYTGNMDDFRIYSENISAERVQSLAAGGYSDGDGGGVGAALSGSTIDVDGDLILINGILDTSSDNCSGASCNVTLSGSWLNYAGSDAFVYETSTVTLNGGNQTATGTGSFYNLTKTVSAAQTLTLTAGDQFDVFGALTLRGVASNLLTLVSSVSGEVAKLILDSGGSQTIDYLDVKDNDASGGQELVCLTATEECTDSGNNTSWLFTVPTAKNHGGSMFFGF